MTFRSGELSQSIARRRRVGEGCVALVLLAVMVTACGGSNTGASSAHAAKGVEKISNYAGSDREAKLLAGAKKEGVLNLYTNPTGDITNAIVSAFEKKYPDVKIKVTQGDSSDLARRIAEEASAGRAGVDVIETTAGALGELEAAKLLASFKTPEATNYADGAITDYLASVRESYLGLGYNTDVVSPNDVPKTLDDLLNPKWKGKISIPTTATGVRWVAALELTKGKAFVDEMAKQQVKGQNISGRALADFVISGEVAMSPAIYDSHVSVSKGKGAHIAWEPIEPAIAVPTALSLSVNSPHPNASMLYIDFALSKEGQLIYQKNGYDSARTDMPSATTFKKIYVDTRKDYAAKYPQWEKDMRSMLAK